MFGYGQQDTKTRHFSLSLQQSDRNCNPYYILQPDVSKRHVPGDVMETHSFSDTRVFWDVMPRRQVNGYRRVEEARCLHLQVTAVHELLTQRTTPEDLILHQHRYKNLKSRIIPHFFSFGGGEVQPCSVKLRLQSTCSSRSGMSSYVYNTNRKFITLRTKVQ
jgi:hypothetical protein